ncbi:MAG: hypothetical protein JSS67_08595 [Bacteroidetes bacterium]|nr:hypothetical protein [Bacteroidota bacterium]
MKKVLLNAIVTVLVSFFSINSLQAQVLTHEDSLANGLISRDNATIISGYGEARYTYDTKRKNAEANLERVVLFVGHKFNNKISLFTELELEDALVIGSGDEGMKGKGEVAMEQAFLKFSLRNPANYFVAGLFIPRLGFINENHLPATFNGVDRPFVEELVIPSTWREIGVGYFGTVKKVPGLNYSIALTNGLNSQGFQNGSGIRDGRQLGSKTQGTSLGLSGSLLYYIGNFRLQASGYIGGTTALEKRVADSLLLNSGPFGNPAEMYEVNGQYTHNGWNMRALFSYVNIPQASAINRAFAHNIPNSLYGGYAELGYNLLFHKYQNEKELIAFGRVEYMDLSATLPVNGIQNDANKQTYIVAGLTYKPIKGVALKADYVQRMTGALNPALIITPFPQQVPYFKNNGFINLGIAYNF